MKRLGQFERVIEIATFENQRQSGDVIQNTAEGHCLFPDVTVHRAVAKLQSQLRGPLHVHACVTLFICHDPHYASTKLGRSFRKREQRPGHHFERLKFMVGHDVMSQRPFFGVD